MENFMPRLPQGCKILSSVPSVASILPCTIINMRRSDSLMPVGINWTSLPGDEAKFGQQALQGEVRTRADAARADDLAFKLLHRLDRRHARSIYKRYDRDWR